MANLLAVLDETKFSSLDETLQGLYKQNTQTKDYYLNLPESEAEKLTFNLNGKVTKLKGDLDKVHKDKKDGDKLLESYQAFGTPEEIQELKESNQPEQVSEIVEKHKAEIEKIKQSYDDKLTKLETDFKTADSQLGQSLKQSTISKLVTQFNLDPEVAPHILKDFIDVRTDENGGEKKVVVIKDGEPYQITGNPAKPDQLISEFIENKTFQKMFNANGGGGTGSTNNQLGSQSKRTQATKEELNAMSPTDKREFYLNGGEQIK